MSEKNTKSKKSKKIKKSVNKVKKISKTGGSVEVIGALTKISEAITSDLYLEDILKLIVSITAEVMGSKICSLMMINEKTYELEIKATQSISERYINKTNIKLGEGISGRAALTGEPIVVVDIEHDKRYLSRDIAKKEHLVSLLSVPLIVKKKVIGVLNCYTDKPHKFTLNEINVVKSVAHQAAIVMENFKLLVESQVIREELESRKVIERAKGILMKQMKLTEEEAYKRIRKFSMDNRKTMREIADAIILRADME
ncbi:ANTAR domain-containing protein [bacterium]